ncbi:MAG: T9SS type A sorting domain-containing protein, partial [Bacteroidetes bacterium]|nr:T9SS type A sorting domain-containing protein [Bacteroidota bacterium]
NNKRGSNNFNQAYEEIDFRIPELNYALNGDTVINDRRYKFQGYLIYQVKNGETGPEDLGDPDKARLVAQCDIKDSVTDLINFRFNEELQVNVPEDIVIRGSNKGILNSFRVTEDRFAQGADRALVNHKPYYFIAIAYGFNEFKKYDPFDPHFLDGQTMPYLLSRKSLTGSIRAYKGTPHNPAPLNGGTRVNAKFGDMPMITRIEGQGNGGMDIEFTSESEAKLFTDGKIDAPQYNKNKGPLNVKVIDPLNVPKGDFEIIFNANVNVANVDNASWTLSNLSTLVVGNNTYEKGKFIVKSDTTIKIRNEQLIPEIGMSVLIEQIKFPGAAPLEGNGALESSIVFSSSGRGWLTGVANRDGETPENWIRSGTTTGTTNGVYDDFKEGNNWKDPKSNYEQMIGGTWAPYSLSSHHLIGPAFDNITVGLAKLRALKSVDVVITSDKTKWTRCPIIENQFDVALAIGGAKKNFLRKSPSVDQEGKPDGTGTGMGWFPGYAVCLETGERLNMAFSEDSWLSSDNGNDMIWNPTSSRYGTMGTVTPNPDNSDEVRNRAARFGGKHFIYVFDNNKGKSSTEVMPAYDKGKTLYDLLESGTPPNMRTAWRSCMWVGFPLLEEDAKMFESEVRVKLRVERPYEKYIDAQGLSLTSSNRNNGAPLYSFNLNDLAVVKGDASVMDTVLTMLNVVPNPYYAYSGYEVNQLDNRVRIINLPEECTVTIYTINGTLIRQFKKGDSSTSIDWDLKNHVNIPIAGGVYLIHINVPNVGERVLKWFGVMRPIDLDSF